MERGVGEREKNKTGKSGPIARNLGAVRAEYQGEAKNRGRFIMRKCKIFLLLRFFLRFTPMTKKVSLLLSFFCLLNFDHCFLFLFFDHSPLRKQDREQNKNRKEIGEKRKAAHQLEGGRSESLRIVVYLLLFFVKKKTHTQTKKK